MGRDKEKLKETLINKLAKFADKRSFGVVFDEKSITNYLLEKDKLKCNIECLLCNAQFTCYYSTYWCASNFEKHLAKHYVGAVNDSEQEFVHFEVISQAENRTEQSNQIYSYANDQDIDGLGV